MKQVLFRGGQVQTEDVPAPCVERGTILVRSAYSCISTGTELSGIQSTGDPLWKRALRNPKAVGSVLKLATTQGVSLAVNAVRSAVTVGQPSGYSASGVIHEVGIDCENIFFPGMRVACAGAQCAHHAEWIRVPSNLAVQIPDTVSSAEASTVALGAIALQGMRRATPTLGETFVVLGLGLLGQLICQILRANGCRAIGIDPNVQRRELAVRLGADMVVDPTAGGDIMQVARLTEGVGADGVIITASTESDNVVSTAFKMSRRKGRVVLVGDVGLNLKRADIYEKELDFLVSTSYGPGRYDSRYENDGVDYPVSYVRWTENRNMQEYLRLIAEGRLDVRSLIHREYEIERASDAYDALRAGSPESRPLIVLLKYPLLDSGPPVRVVSFPRKRQTRTEGVRIAVVGAGSFATGVHLPNLERLKSDFTIQAIANRTGHRAFALARQFNANLATTDYESLLVREDIDAFIIATRHDQHAQLALRALKSGKHVLLEKPLCLKISELNELEDFYATRNRPNDLPVLMTGFNRRFSPHIQHILQLVASRSDAMLLNYRMNAGYLPPDNWVHGPEGGGRNRGEACHLYDLAIAIIGHKVERISVERLRPRYGHYLQHDNFAVSLRFGDGSLANILYTSLGSANYPKEQLEVYVDGMVIRMTEYKQTEVFGRKRKGLTTRLVEKGHLQELQAFSRVLRDGGDWPISLQDQVAATRVSFEVERQLNE